MVTVSTMVSLSIQHPYNDYAIDNVAVWQGPRVCPDALSGTDTNARVVVDA
jgi:hypothetical protein